VKVRIYLDGSQLAEREPARVFQDLAQTPGVEIRIKRSHGAPMHLKSYQIDGRVLRRVAANFSASGLKRQENDLIIIDSPVAAAKFRHAFETRFASRQAISLVEATDYRRPFPAARYCVQSARTSIGRPPHLVHRRCQRSAGISINSARRHRGFCRQQRSPRYVQLL
jgi:phosphatidylserine/phosphatidylglycerophosphate/cardiolipin synthase-like enzyme